MNGQTLFEVFCFFNLCSAKVNVDMDSAFGEVDDVDEDGGDRVSPPQERINLSVPGTRWCGPGNTADDYDHLGSFSAEDECCRAHGNNFDYNIINFFWCKIKI